MLRLLMPELLAKWCGIWGDGRLAKGDILDPEVGIDRMASLHEAVTQGISIDRIHAASEAAAADAAERVGAAFQFTTG
jgi:thymidine phosphorylase